MNFSLPAPRSRPIAQPAYLAAFARVCVGVVFLAAAGIKLSNVDFAAGHIASGVPLFAASIAAHGIIPAPLSTAVAATTIASEVAIGIALLPHRKPRLIASLAAILLLTFSAYVLLVRIRTGDAACGCFGRLSKADFLSSILRNAALLASLIPSFSLTSPSKPTA